MSKIEQIITEIEDYINSCKPTPFSSSKISVDKATIEELLAELRQRTPDEIKKYQKIISNKEAIIAEAKSQADQMIADATAKTNELINEHEIMQHAYEQANMITEEAQKQAQNIVDRAVEEANAVREGAVAYTDDMLNSMLVVMKHAMEGADNKFDAYMQAMKSSYEIVESNLKELRGMPAGQPEEGNAAPADSYYDEDAQDAAFETEE